jgi:hypothetical protein
MTKINHPVWIHGAAILMVLHGSHQYTPVMLAFFYQHQPDPSWAMKFWGVPFFFPNKVQQRHADWWFGTCFIFPNSWDDDPI